MTKVKLDYRQLISHYAMTTSRLIDLHVFTATLQDAEKTILQGVTGRFRQLHNARSLFSINMVERDRNCKLCLKSLVLGNDSKDTHLHEC